MGVIVAIVGIAVVIALGAGIAAVFKSSLKAGKKDAANAALPDLTEEDRKKLSDARRSLAKTRQLILRVEDAELKGAAEGVLSQAEAITAEMKKQPAEVRRARQFFLYYLPTLNTVLEKYLALESNGMATDEQKSGLRDFLSETARAFGTQYENMFTDEKLDLEVETEAMEVALKRDGLL